MTPKTPAVIWRTILSMPALPKTETPRRKVIAAVVERQLCNEVIRRIEGVTGSLFACMGVMVTVQDRLLAGALEM